MAVRKHQMRLNDATQLEPTCVKYVLRHVTVAYLAPVTKYASSAFPSQRALSLSTSQACVAWAFQVASSRGSVEQSRGRALRSARPRPGRGASLGWVGRCTA
jgi:hypothetical protein